MKKIIFLVLSMLLGGQQLGLAEIDPILAIRAIVGEAAGESFIGKVAVAEAIRNRGHLKGVYGVKAKHIWAEPNSTWNEAKKAWEMSKKTDIVKRGDHWENTKAFGEPSWAKKMVKTAQIGNHSFYRSKK